MTASYFHRERFNAWVASHIGPLGVSFKDIVYLGGRDSRHFFHADEVFNKVPVR